MPDLLELEADTDECWERDDEAEATVGGTAAASIRGQVVYRSYCDWSWFARGAEFVVKLNEVIDRNERVLSFLLWLSFLVADKNQIEHIQTSER